MWLSRNHREAQLPPTGIAPRQAVRSPPCLFPAVPILPDLHPAGRDDVQTAGGWQGSGSPNGGAGVGLEAAPAKLPGRPCRAPGRR